MITRDEYLKALDTVEAYHKQLNLFNVRLSSSGLTKIDDWLNNIECSPRLRNVLRAVEYHNELIYIESINPKDLRRYRNTGKKTVDEFIKLRGF